MSIYLKITCDHCGKLVEEVSIEDSNKDWDQIVEAMGNAQKNGMGTDYELLCDECPEKLKKELDCIQMQDSEYKIAKGGIR